MLSKLVPVCKSYGDELTSSAIMVPMINTPEEAESVVRFSKFPPLGVRGQGSPFTAVAHGITTPEYLKIANQTLMTMVQIETAQAVKNVDAIAKVEGVGKSLFAIPIHSG